MAETNKRWKVRKFCDNVCRSKHLSITSSGEKNYFFGKHLNPWNKKDKTRWVVTKDTGYRVILYRDGDRKWRRYEHREIAKNAIGRELQAGEVVHHIDGDRANNDPSNLLVMTISEHVKFHARERRDRNKLLSA